MKATPWKPAGMILILGLLLSTTGCGTLLNLSGISTIQNPKVRVASVMGGVQTVTYFIERLQSGHGSDYPCGPGVAALDLVFSLAADATLLPITLTIAAIVGDVPFASDPQSRPPVQEANEDDAPQGCDRKHTH